MKKEFWKDIKGYEGLYQISNYGRIRSLKFRNNVCEKYRVIVMKPNLRNGYLVINLRKNMKRKSFQVHRLVAQAFIENPFNYPIVNHIDYNRQNNNAENLEWCTQKQNVNHSTCNMKGISHNIKKQNYGITYREKQNKYELSIKKKYYGRYRTLKEARKKRDEVLNELNIAR
jgi:hypothetical protein